MVTCLGDQLEGLSEVSICAVPEGSRVYRFSNIFLHSVWSCYCESELSQLLTIPYAPNLCGSDLLGSLNGSCSISWRTEDTIEIQTISPSQVYRANQRKGQASSDPETLVSPRFLDNPNLRGVIGRHAFCMTQTHIHNLHQFVYKILQDMTSICIVLHYHELCFATLQLFDTALIFANHVDCERHFQRLHSVLHL